MNATINKLYDKVTHDERRGDVVTALFYWDGKDRSVRVPAGKCHVGDKITVSLEEYYNKEKGRMSVWWEWKGMAE